MKIDHFDVVLEKEEDSPYIGGDFIVGSIKINVISKIEISKLTVSLRGIIKTGWKNKKSSAAIFESVVEILNETLDLTSQILNHCDDKNYLQCGLHIISFQYKLPFAVLSSIEQENLGCIRYNIQAILEIPEDGYSEIITERPILIFSYLNLDAPHLLNSTTVSDQAEITNCCSKCRGRKRIINTTVTIGQLGIFPGDQCVVKIEVDQDPVSSCCNPLKRHKNKETKCISVSFCQQTTFRSRNRFDPKIVDEKSITLALASQSFHHDYDSNSTIVKDIVFPVPDLIPPTTINENELISCCYFFKIFSKNFYIVVPVIVGSTRTNILEKTDDLFV
ncbi:Arrestin-like, N-terminal domain and Immunoglobulin E-set domain-containing protein [Strongyloides ratti]|uniref:Arrestin-like, N-terminal domain and Immunoglobulin E-set domain-containing protein n=1 Tax=Strongyloides ratti TaxID=34506 RepID=A0A090KVL2_STRRB|nr:Arrestin-like, N-terminal domain and Immunoglobulin E-set domain-containing protein [Strongyloides ratti]CEF59910.1 Arrestin-like, N-terminal domain and Immunoglobulin E-set domain-containing protein [Strongyloides ratti]